MNLTIPLKSSDPLALFLKRLDHVIENHDYNHYKLEHQSADTTLKVQKLKKLISSSTTFTYEFSDSQITLLLFSLFASKDVTKCYTLLLFICLTHEGNLIAPDVHYKHSYNSPKHNEIKLAGMDNWNNLLCYFDSLIFAMFGRLDDYDNSLLIANEDDSVLVTEFKFGLRLLVNLMRSGEANITTDIIQVICKIFADLGFKELVSKKQQDVVSCFETLCDYLNVPLLTLKIDIIHSGKIDLNDDLKYMSERVLFISIPEDKISDLKTDTIQEEEDTSNKMSFSKIMKGGKRSKKDKDETINLEDCLNNYFNNSVKVKRVLERRRTLTLERSNTSPIPNRTIGLTPESSSSTALDTEDISSDETSGDDQIDGVASNDDLSYRDKDLLSARDLKERNDFLGVVSYSNEYTEEPSPLDTTKPVLLYPTPSRTSYHSMASSYNRSVDSTSPFSQDIDDTLTSRASNGSDNAQSYRSNSRDLLKRTASSPVTNLPLFRSNSLRHSRRDSISKINEIITLTRSRSSTDASILSMTPIIKRTNSTSLSHTINSGLEVTLPAWMFLQLLPYYSDFDADARETKVEDSSISDEKPSMELVENSSKDEISRLSSGTSLDDAESLMKKAYSKKRPIVPICLKRYIYNEKGVTQKINKKFNIPTVIDLPYFVADDKPTLKNNEHNNKSFDQFRLVLESVVCHRGNSVDSGHYVAAARKHPYAALKGKKHKEDEQVWLLFNDIKDADEKITETTFKQIMDTEAPYLLFYRIEDHDFDPKEVNLSSASTIKKVETADNSIISGSSILKDKHILDRISTSGALDARDLRKNSVISSLSLVSSSLRKEKEEDLKLINSASSTAASSTAASSTAANAVTVPKISTDVAPDEPKNGRHQHHTFSFTRSLSRSSSRPPMSKKDHVSPDNLDFIDFYEKFYWYYPNHDGTISRQTKADALKIPVPVLRSPSYQTESYVSDSEVTTKDLDSTESTFQKVTTPKKQPHNDDSTITTPTSKLALMSDVKSMTERVSSPAASTRAAKKPSIRLPRRALTINAGRPKSTVKTSTPVVTKTPKKTKKESKHHQHEVKSNHKEKCVIM